MDVLSRGNRDPLFTALPRTVPKNHRATNCILSKIPQLSTRHYVLFRNQYFLFRLFYVSYTGVLTSLQPDQAGNKLVSMSGTRAFPTKSKNELSSSFFSCKARRQRKFMPFWQKHQLVSFLVGLRIYQNPCVYDNSKIIRTYYDQTQIYVRNQLQHHLPYRHFVNLIVMSSYRDKCQLQECRHAE